MLISTFVFFIFIILLAVVSLFKKHRTSYLQGKITHSVILRNIFLDIFGILLAMVLAGAFGRFISRMATAYIIPTLFRIIVGILLGVLAGACVGLLIKRVRVQFVKP